MIQTQNEKPDIVQSFDFYEDRIYSKIIGGFFFQSSSVVRKDRIRNWKEWKIECKDMPDFIFVNGKEMKLVDCE